MNTQSLPKSLRKRLSKPKQDYQGNYETFDMPENLKPDAPTSTIPFGKIGAVFAVIVLLTFIGLIIFSMLSDSESFL